MDFEQKLTGGHHNSLGNTVEVVEEVLKNRSRLEELYQCYFSEDEVVRLRVSSAMKRLCIAHPEWIYPYTDKLLDEISQIDQASTQWTLAILFGLLADRLTDEQREKALMIMKNNLANHHDWIVINYSMETLFEWSKTDDELLKWLIPQLEHHCMSDRKSIAGRARKYLDWLATHK